MSKWFKCTVYASKFVLVEVEDDHKAPEKEAMSEARMNAFHGDYDKIEEDGEISPAQLSSEKHHADLVIPLYR